MDLYSLGIILFEMCFPVASMHERAIVLTVDRADADPHLTAVQELRRAHIPIPDAFDHEKYALEERIIKQLLTHKCGTAMHGMHSHRCSPEQRLTLDALLRMLPAKVEDSALSEILKALSDRETAAHSTLMQALFSQARVQSPWLLLTRRRRRG